MNLEDMVAQTKYPILGIEVLAEYLQDEICENFGFFRANGGKELYKKYRTLSELLIAATKHLQDVRDEFKEAIKR